MNFFREIFGYESYPGFYRSNADLETSRKKIAAGAQQGIVVGLPQRKLISRVPRSPQRSIQRKLPDPQSLSIDQSSMVPRRPASRSGPPADSIPDVAQAGQSQAIIVPAPVTATRVLSTAEVFSLMDSFLADHPDARQLFAQHYQVPTLPPAQDGGHDERPPNRPPTPPPDTSGGQLHPLMTDNCASDSLQKRLTGLVSAGVKKVRQLCQTYLVTAGKVHRLEQM